MMDDYTNSTPLGVAANSSDFYFGNGSYGYTQKDGMLSADDDNRYQMQLIQHYISGICGMTVSALGIVGNVMSIIILTRRVMRSSTYSYLTALALSDTFFLIFTMLIVRRDLKKPVEGQVNTYDDEFYAKTFPYFHALCLTCQMTSIWLTLAFTVDRYIMICHPFKAERCCSIKRARWVIFSLTVAGVAFNFIRFFEYEWHMIYVPTMSDSYTEYFNSNTTKTGVELFVTEKYVNNLTNLGVNPLFQKIVHVWFYLTCVAGIPFIALFVLNISLIIAVHNSRKKGKLINAKEKRRNDTTIMLIGVIVIFLVCEGPALISRMMYALDFENSLYSLSYGYFSEVSNLLVIINSAINIVPYYFFGKKFRQQFWRVFCTCVLTKEEIRKITRSLSVSMDRRFSNAGANGHELNQIAVFQQQQQQKEENNKVYKNSIAVPLILNIEGRGSVDTQIPFISAHQNNYLDDLSPSNQELTNEQKKVLVSLEANGNCEIMVDSPCSDCQNKAIL